LPHSKSDGDWKEQPNMANESKGTGELVDFSTIACLGCLTPRLVNHGHTNVSRHSFPQTKEQEFL
jgi:hypothetical protein